MNSREIAQRYGTPTYVYDLREVRSAVRLLRASLPAGSHLYYSLKANPHVALIATLLEQGCRAEVSSPNELVAALTGGASAEEILYTGPAKSTRELAFALARGVRWFSVESPRDLARLEECCMRAEVTANCIVRVNPEHDTGGAGLVMTGAATQFGVDELLAVAQPEALASTSVHVRGIHVYAGSSLGSTTALLESFEDSLAAAARVSAALGVETLELLDLGGGFGHPFARTGPQLDFRDLAEPLSAAVDAACLALPQRCRPQLAFESGRYLVGASGRLVCTVQDVKLSRGRRFVLLDSGINHLGGMHGLRRLRGMQADLLIDADGNAETAPADVVGPLCTPLDVWGRGIELPDVQPGDVVTVPNVGAYGLTASLVGFLGRELPLEVVVDGDRSVDVSRLELARIDHPDHEWQTTDGIDYVHA